MAYSVSSIAAVVFQTSHLSWVTILYAWCSDGDRSQLMLIRPNMFVFKASLAAPRPSRRGGGCSNPYMMYISFWANKNNPAQPGQVLANCLTHYKNYAYPIFSSWRVSSFWTTKFAKKRKKTPKAPTYSYWGVGVTLTGCGASWLSGSVRDLQARDRGFDPRLPWMCFDVVLLGKALCSHVHSLDPGVSGYLVGQWRLVCWDSSVRRNEQSGCMLPGELRWLMNEQVLWLGGNCIKSAEMALHARYQAINFYLYLYNSMRPRLTFIGHNAETLYTRHIYRYSYN